jgi:hypothetical protein
LSEKSKYPNNGAEMNVDGIGPVMLLALTSTIEIFGSPNSPVGIDPLSKL